MRELSLGRGRTLQEDLKVLLSTLPNGAKAKLLLLVVVQGNVRWGDQPALKTALQEAFKKRYGDVWSWDREKSPVDVAPLCAVTFALWGLYNLGEGSERETVYGDDYGEWWEG